MPVELVVAVLTGMAAGAMLCLLARPQCPEGPADEADDF